MKNFICSQYGVQLATLNAENIITCGWVTKLETIKMSLFAFSSTSAEYLQKIWIFNFPMLYGFCSKFCMLSSSAKVWKSVKIWQSYRQFRAGDFLRDSVEWGHDGSDKGSWAKPLNLNHVLHLHNKRSWPICPKICYCRKQNMYRWGQWLPLPLQPTSGMVSRPLFRPFCDHKTLIIAIHLYMTLVVLQLRPKWGQ